MGTLDDGDLTPFLSAYQRNQGKTKLPCFHLEEAANLPFIVQSQYDFSFIEYRIVYFS